MKFILLDIQDIDKIVVNKISLNDTCYINEVVLSKKILNDLQTNSKGIINKIKKSFNTKMLDRRIFEALEKHDKKWYYLLSKNAQSSNFVKNKAQELLGYKLLCENELDSNIFKYADEYIEKNDKIKKQELKALLVVSKNANFNVNLLHDLIREFKVVDIVLGETTSSYILKKIKQINKAEGTSIDIIKKERKSFVEYNLVYFEDDVKESYPRFRFNKEALIIDNSLITNDKFNSNIIFINNYINKQGVCTENIKKLQEKYNSVELASVIRRIATT